MTTLSPLLRSLFLVIGVLTAQACLRGAEPPSPAAPWTADVDKLFAKWDRKDSPGCAVGIVQRGRLVYCKGIGSANLEHQTPNTPQTVFETASFAKSFTCACLALLMDEGKIAPQDELRKFVPEMHAFDPPIRIEHMVRCKSGLWDQVSIPILIGWENAPQQHPHTEADFFSLITGQKTLPFKPGTEFRYSSGDYALLGLIIKRVSGQSIAEFARRQIFGPLGMHRTFFEEDPTRVVHQRAVGHYKRGGDDWHLWQPTAFWAGGGCLKTCVEDLVRWDHNFDHCRLPRGKYMDEFLRDGTLLGNRYCLDADAYAKEANPQARGGPRVGEFRGLKHIQFTGGAWGFTTAMTRFADKEFTVICLSNCGEITAWTMNKHIAQVCLADHLQPPSTKPAARAASELPAVALTEAQLREKVGAYRMKATGLIWQISLKDGSLQLTDHLKATYPLRPLSATEFDPAGPFYATTKFVFQRAKPGEPITMVSQWEEPDNEGQLDFEPVQLVRPSPEQLQEYTGEYVSDELAATYRLMVREGQLWLRVNSRRWEQLDATVRDSFIPHLRDPTDGRIINFRRDKSGKVTGLAVDYYRVRGVEFAKR